MTKKTTEKKAKKEVVEEDRFVVSALVNRKGGYNDFSGENIEKGARTYSAALTLAQIQNTISTWEQQREYYRDIRVHEVGPPKKVKIQTIIEELA